MRTTLRSATPPDLKRLLPLVRAYYAFERIRFSPARAKRALAELLRTPVHGRIWLVCRGADPVGYIILCFSYSVENGGGDAIVDEFFLLEPFRGRGIGGQALRLVKAELRRMKFRSISLEVSRDNPHARRFYAARGFQARDRYFLMDAVLRPRSQARKRRLRPGRQRR